MKKLFDIKITEIDSQDIKESGSPAHFQQSLFWGKFKERHGWALKRFSILWTFLGEGENVKSRSENTQNVIVMVRTFSRLFSLAYIPLYPALPFECDADTTAESQTIEFASFLNEIALSLKPFLPKNTICVRFDPDVDFASPEERDRFNYGVNIVSYADRLKLRKSSVDIQPPDTTAVDLDGTEDEILGRMKSKWRYNIHLAERKGVQVEKVARNIIKMDTEVDDMPRNDINLSTGIDIFYDLYKITSERDGIAIHPKSYYQDLLEMSDEWNSAQKDAPLVTLYIARHEEDYLGSIITLFTKSEGIYLYGASSNVKRNLMPNFLLQWTAMKDAKAFGSKYYDLYGMPPTDDENHPMHGLYLFKTGFAGKNIHRIGSYDVKLSALYGVCTFAERARAWWHKKFLKKIRGR